MLLYNEIKYVSKTNSIIYMYMYNVFKVVIIELHCVFFILN